MKNLARAAMFVGALALPAAAFATNDIFHGQVGESSVVVGSNTITIQDNVKYVNYVEGDTLDVKLHYDAPCNVQILSVTAGPKEFTPKGVNGTGPTAIGLPSAIGHTGDVEFQIAFSPLKKAGKAKKFGMAHLVVSLMADSNCDLSTDTQVDVNVNVSASTATHP